MQDVLLYCLTSLVFSTSACKTCLATSSSCVLSRSASFSHSNWEFFFCTTSSSLYSRSDTLFATCEDHRLLQLQSWMNYGTMGPWHVRAPSLLHSSKTPQKWKLLQTTNLHIFFVTFWLFLSLWSHFSCLYDSFFFRILSDCSHFAILIFFMLIVCHFCGFSCLLWSFWVTLLFLVILHLFWDIKCVFVAVCISLWSFFICL